MAKTFTFKSNPFRVRFIPMLLASMALMMLVSCEPTPVPGTSDTIPASDSYAGLNHALVLCEGPMGNYASLSLLNLSSGKLQNDWFAACNGRDLGNVAQDAVVYGSRAYVTVWGSGSLEVIDTATGVSTHVDLGNCGPRYIATDGGKLYVTCYSPHAVLRIDTTTLQVEATCTLGDFNPEGIAAAKGRLFVASDNIAQADGYHYDNKLYVVDIASFSVVDSITVGINPQKVLAVDESTLVVNFWGEWDLNTYATIGEGAAFVDVNTFQVRQVGRLLSNMTVANGMVYGYSSVYNDDGSTSASFFRVDPYTVSAEEILPSCDINDPYAIAVHPLTGEFFVGTHANYRANGDVCLFAPDGVLQWRSEVGLLPSKILFY